jgi:hypothetical protein
MTPLLRVLENEVQLSALGFLGAVYVAKLIWLFRFPSRRERTFAAGSGNAGVAVSMVNILTPWQMESTRTRPTFYIQFALFHLAVAAAILLSFLIPYAPGALASGGVVFLFGVLLAAGTAVGAARLVRRLRSPALRLISTPDDYLSLSITLAFFLTGLLAVTLGRSGTEWPLILFFALTAAFLVYVPFSKICHYLYYPFTRFFFGRSLGHRGVLGSTRVGYAARNRTRANHG